MSMNIDERVLVNGEVKWYGRYCAGRNMKEYWRTLKEM